MSRSYRKPYQVDSYGSKAKKYFKRLASKRVRKSKNVPNGKAYIKFNDPYNIVDSISYDDCKPYFCSYFMEWSEPTPRWKAIRK